MPATNTNEPEPGVPPFPKPSASRSLAEKTVEDLLLCFGKDVKTARREYRQFVKDGIEKGRRPEFQGGGLIRSSGGGRVGLLGLEEEEREESDQRVLGSGDFVSNAVKASHDAYDRRTGKRIPLAELSKKVSSYFEIKEEDLRSPVKKRSVTQARSGIRLPFNQEDGLFGT